MSAVRSWKRRVRHAATAAGVLAGGTLATTVGLGYYVAHVLTAPRRPGLQDHYVMTPFETGATYEEVAFAPASGEHLVRGWWFPRPETARVIIGCHGYRGSKSELIGIAS